MDHTIYQKLYQQLANLFTNSPKSATFNIRSIVLSRMEKLKIKNLKLKNTLLIFSSFYVLFFTLYISPVRAQINSIGIATYLEVTGNKIEDSSIVVVTKKGYALSSIPYEPNIVGVVNLNPAISLKTDKQKRGFPVITAGSAYAKVNGTNGAIKIGDSITTSAVPGTAMRSSESGFVLGEALADAVFTKSNDTKIIEVAINPHYVQLNNQLSNSLFDIFKLSKIAAYEKPSKALQYILATAIILISFGSGFLIFSKVISKGIEALGRNPLAGRMIQLSIVFNVLLIVIIIVIGTGLAYLVIRL